MAQEDKDYKKVIGSRLRDLRTKRKPGYHRCDVADELGMAHSTYNDYEGGRRGPNGGVLIEFAKYYNTTVDYITGNTDDDSPVDENNLFDALSKVERIVSNKNGKSLSEEDLLMIENNLNNLLLKIKKSSN
jgi:transcriptional regulator with XRE-family HTH domain